MSSIYQWCAVHGCCGCGASLKFQNLRGIFIPCHIKYSFNFIFLSFIYLPPAKPAFGGLLADSHRWLFFEMNPTDKICSTKYVHLHLCFYSFLDLSLSEIFSGMHISEELISQGRQSGRIVNFGTRARFPRE